MREDERRGDVPQCELHDLSRVYRCLSQRAAKHLLRGQHAILRIQEKAYEHLMLDVGEDQTEIVAHRVRLRQCRSARQVLLEPPSYQRPRS